MYRLRLSFTMVEIVAHYRGLVDQVYMVGFVHVDFSAFQM